jgi:FMN phosphatase YigB (HAD superfamily)
MGNMEKIKHVSFDFWGTIANPNPEFYAAREKYLSEISGKSEEFVIETIERLKLEYEELGKKHLVGVPAVTQTWVLLKSLGFEYYVAGQLIQVTKALTSLFYKYPPILILDLNILYSLFSSEISCSVTCNTGFISGPLVKNWMRKHLWMANVFNYFIFSDEFDNLFKPNPLICDKIMENFNLSDPSSYLWLIAPD